jgi:hypothetical protein
MADALGVPADEYDTIMTRMVEADLELSDAPEAQAAAAAARRVTAVTALHHRTEIGVRVASVLAAVGVLDPPASPIDPQALAALGNAGHPRRLDLPAGPWIFLRPAAEDRQNQAQYVPDLVFHPDQSVRRAAMAHLVARLPPAEEWLTPGTRATIEVLADDVGREEVNASREAARAVDGALARDFLLPLAVFRQTRAAQMQEENNDALCQLLDPRAGVFGSIPSSWYRVPGEEWEAFRQATADDPALAAALDRYYRRYGHLPLAAPQAVESIVRAWTAAHGEEGVWDAVRAWARDECRPLKAYHACRIFLGIPSLVPEERRGEAWSAVTEALDGYSGTTPEATPHAEAWHLLHILARHYHQTLEVDAHEADATALAAAAWWAAERVTAQLVSAILAEQGRDRGVGTIRTVRQQAVERLARRSTVGWLLGRPVRAPSALAYATVSFTSLWRAALLEAGPAAGLAVPAEHAASVLTLIAQTLEAGFPPRLGVAAPPLFATDASLRAIGLCWLAALPEAARPGELLVDEEVNSESEYAETAARLRTIADAPEEVRDLIVQQFRSAVSLGFISGKDLGWLREDQAWWDRVFETLSPDQLVSLSTILLELIRYGTEEWQLEFPRMLRRQAMRDDLIPERRTVAAGAVLESAVICGHASALTLLVQESTVPDVLDAFGTWRRRLNDIRRVSPPPVQARLRSVLALLPPESDDATA